LKPEQLTEEILRVAVHFDHATKGPQSAGRAKWNHHFFASKQKQEFAVGKWTSEEEGRSI